MIAESVDETHMQQHRDPMALPRRAVSAIRRANEWLLGLSYRFDLPFVIGGPAALMVEPSAACNLRCPLCPNGIRITDA